MSKKRTASTTDQAPPTKLKKLPSSSNKYSINSPKPKVQPTKSNATQRQDGTISLSNQADFPRGGGIPLTPYQLAEAKRDGAQQAERLVKSFNPSQAKLHSSKRSPSESSALPKGHIPSGAYRIEHLNSKRLIPGIKLAGIIIEIRPLALIVSLPSHLVGYVSISEISSAYTKRLDEIVEQEDLESDNSSHDSLQSQSSLKGLNQLFAVGQWVRCSVIQTTSDGSRSKTRYPPLISAAMKVNLSLDPVHVNSGILKSHLQSGITLTGAVKSLEDKGYVIDFGISIDPNIHSVPSSTSSNNLNAFVSFVEATQSTGLNHIDDPSYQWEIGQIIWCRVNKLSENGTTCVVSVKPQDLCKSVLTTALNINSILPLHMVSCQITSIIPSLGLNVNFLGFFKGCIDFSHLGLDGTNVIDLNQKFQIGQKLSARVLWNTIPSQNHASFDDHDPILGPKIFSLTLLDYIVKQDFPGLPPELSNGQSRVDGDKIDQIVQYPVGYIFQTVRIHRVVEEWGLCVSCINKQNGHSVDLTPSGKLPAGFVHISAIADAFIPSLQQHSGPYKIGSTHKARVTGISPVDGCLQLSLKASVIEQVFMRPEDVPVGAFVEVSVKELTSSLLKVKIHDTMDAVIWPDHFSDVKLRQPEKKFKPGTKLKARVLRTNPEKNQVVLTLRNTLLKPDTEIITSYQSARVGSITYGLVKTVKKNFMIVTFFGQTQALIPINHADTKFVESMTDHFSSGQLVKVKITAVDAHQSRIVASVKLAISDGIEKNPTILKNGDQVSAFVTRVEANCVKLNLYQFGAESSTSDPVRGLISLKLLASKQGFSPADLQNRLNKGDEIKGLRVTGKDQHKNSLIVGFTSPTSASEFITPPVSLAVGDQVNGTIRFLNQNNLVLHLYRDTKESASEAPIEGFLSIALLAQKRKVSIDELKAEQLIGQKISGLQLIHQDEEKGVLVVGFNDFQSNVPNAAVNPDHTEPPVLSASDRVIGRIYRIGNINIQLHLRKEGTEGYADEKGIISIAKVAQHRHISEEELRSTIKVGDYIYDLMIRKKTGNNGSYLIGFTPSEKTLHPALVASQVVPSKPLQISVGDSVIGTVQAIHEKNIVFSLQKEGCKSDEEGSPALGVMSVQMLASHWRKDVTNLKDKLKEGQILRKLIVNKIEPNKNLMIVGFAAASIDLPPSIDKIKLGMVLAVRTKSRTSEGLLVTPIHIPPANWTFLVDYTDINDNYDEKIRLDKDSAVSAVVVQVKSSLSMIYLSTRPSDLDTSSVDSAKNSITDPPIRSLKFSKGDIVRGFVQKLSKVGLILQVGTGIRATVPTKYLISDWKTKYQVGQVVSGKITSPGVSNFPIMSLLERPDRPNADFNCENLKVGQAFETQVSKIESYGMFLQVPGTRIRGLCHSSQVFDDEENSRKKFQEARDQKKFEIGMKLRASLHSIDIENKKIQFTIKPSIVAVQLPNQNADQSTQDGSDGGRDDGLSDSENLLRLPSKVQPKQRVNQPPTIRVDFSEPSLPLSTSFVQNVNQSKQLDETSNSDEQSIDGNYVSRSGVWGSHKNGNPTEERSVNELEELLLESPNSSQLWIRLIQIYIQKAEINQARATAKRALEAIHYREEDEKWKVWICLLNLDNIHGTEEQFTQTFNEASVCNNTKTVWLKVADIYSQSGKIEKAEELYSKTIKKFGQSCKVWCSYGAFCLQGGPLDQFGDLLSRSLKILPKWKHIKTIRKFAQLEFKLGDPERGRTIFEGLVGTYPKRTDLWQVYIDLEIKSGSPIERIRGLFMRLTGLKLHQKSMKFCFKRWYKFEENRGDEESRAMVIEKAQSYVSSLITSNTQDHSACSSSEHEQTCHEHESDASDDETN